MLDLVTQATLRHIAQEARSKPKNPDDVRLQLKVSEELKAAQRGSCGSMAEGYSGL